MTSEETKGIPIIVCGDINDGPGLDASEKRLLGGGVERLMGTVWKPERCLLDALFDGIEEKKRAKLDFVDITTASFQDPVFNYAWHRERIACLLYTDNLGEP